MVATSRTTRAEESWPLHQHQRDSLAHSERADRQAYRHLSFRFGCRKDSCQPRNIVMRNSRADGSVFVTGNAPLVDVLNATLSASHIVHRDVGAPRCGPADGLSSGCSAGGVSRELQDCEGTQLPRTTGQPHLHHQEDGRILVFDEAQRTYEKGESSCERNRQTTRYDLILDTTRCVPNRWVCCSSFVGHNQAINRGERGLWLARSRGPPRLDVLDRRGRLWLWPSSRSRKSGLTIPVVSVWSTVTFASPYAITGMPPSRNGCRRSLKVTPHERWPWLLRRPTTSTFNAEPQRRQTMGKKTSGRRAESRANWLWRARRLAAEGSVRRLQARHSDLDVGAEHGHPLIERTAGDGATSIKSGLELDYCIVCWDADLRH